MTTNIMLDLQNISWTANKGLRLERPILGGLNFTLARGEFVSIIGGNGAGKSTMLGIISGEITPDANINSKIIVDDIDITTTSLISRSPYIAQVSQDPRVGTIDSMTIFENLAFAHKRGKFRSLIPFNNNKTIFQEKLSLLGIGLENRLDELVLNLSGGQRQALSLIMAIITNSKILLLDEITAALDPKTSEVIMKLTNKIVREQHVACLMITHNLNHAIKYSDRIAVLREGKIATEYNASNIKHLTPAELLSAIN